MDTVLRLQWVAETPPKPHAPFRSVLEYGERFATAKRLPDYRKCQTLVTRLEARLVRWWHADDFFSNRTTMEDFAHFTRLLTEQIIMARNTKGVPSFQRSEWKGFVEYRLTDEQLEEADALKMTSTQAFEQVHRLNMLGYKLTVSYSASQKLSTATLIAGKEQGAADGYALSARDENAASALKLLLFKHVVAMSEDWTPFLATTPKAKRG